MIAPLMKTIEVPCDQKQAFTVFLEMNTWWPSNRFATSVMRGQTVKTISVEARREGASSKSPPTAVSISGALSGRTIRTST